MRSILVRYMALIPIVLAIGAASASAAPILVDFQADDVGYIPGNDFTSHSAVWEAGLILFSSFPSR